MGPCAKQVVTATLITRGGQRFVGRNDCLNPQSTCPRDEQGYKSGEGYHLCKEVCEQLAHAEVIACLRAGYENARGSTIYLEGHSYACKDCRELAAVYGVKRIVIGQPLEQNPDLRTRRRLKWA